MWAPHLISNQMPKVHLYKSTRLCTVPPVQFRADQAAHTKHRSHSPSSLLLTVGALCGLLPPRRLCLHSRVSSHHHLAPCLLILQEAQNLILSLGFFDFRRMWYFMGLIWKLLWHGQSSRSDNKIFVQWWSCAAHGSAKCQDNDTIDDIENDDNDFIKVIQWFSFDKLKTKIKKDGNPEHQAPAVIVGGRHNCPKCWNSPLHRSNSWACSCSIEDRGVKLWGCADVWKRTGNGGKEVSLFLQYPINTFHNY